MSEENGELVARAVGGDAEALSELLRLHGPEVERTLRISTVWRAALEPADVMQVTYLEAFIRIQTFDPTRGTRFASWLRQIAENNLKDAVRGLERQKQPQPRDRVRPPRYEDSVIGLCNLLGVASRTPSRHMREREMCEQLERALESLPERYAQVIRLYDLEDRSIEDVARELGRSSGAVYMLRARAHDCLRERLGTLSDLI